MKAGQRIVLVEDERTLRTIIGHNLRARGYRVVEAASGEAALAALALGPSALLLLDVHLPDMTGWEVLRQLPAQVPRQLPTIVISAATPHPERLREFAWITFLHKPFSLDALLRLIATQLGARAGDTTAEAASQPDVPTH